MKTENATKIGPEVGEGFGGYLFNSWRDIVPDRDDWRWPNFSPAEIACKGTGRVLVVPDALDALQELRNRMGAPLLLTSAYRSPEHNRRVGGAPASRHLEGIAFDIMVTNVDPEELIHEAMRLGFRAVGRYPHDGFVHLDMRRVPASWGDPFPDTGDGSRFRDPPPRRSEVESRARAEAGPVGALGSVAAAVAADLVSTGGEVTSEVVERFSGFPWWAILALAVLGAAYFSRPLWAGALRRARRDGGWLEPK